MDNNKHIITILKIGGSVKHEPPKLKKAVEAPTHDDDNELEPHELDDKGSVRPVKGNEKHWGYHLILDLSDCNHAVDDPEKVSSYLEELVEALDMEAVGKPIVHQFTNPHARGTSGVQIITTSSITFHSDDINWCAYIDIFSCKEFEPQTAIDLTEEYFEPRHVGKFWLLRDAGQWPE